MSWLQLIIQCNGNLTEQLDDALMALGACAVTLVDNADQPLFEPPPGATPVWDESRLTALFEKDVDLDQIITTLKQLVPVEPFPDYRCEALEDKDWEREWMDNYHPMQFGQRLWVCPSWKEAPEPGAVNLMLDPGLAFGTGTHPTTSLCLQWLDGLDLADKTLIDYGCGSGILAIAGLLLGAQRAIGIDNDPQALTASRDNANRNNVLERLEVFSPEAAPDDQADVLIANILAGPLITLVDQIAERIKPGGLIALSGILEEQKELVLNAYQEKFTDLQITQLEDWIRISGKKKG